ncbi:MAG TPA: matrixin family metalloprotease [Terriglobales bacterium]|jgi:hypothetical protein
MKWRLLSLALPMLVAAAVLVYVVPAHSFLPEATIVGGSLVGDHWASSSMPIPWQINNTVSGANIAGTPASVQTATVTSFSTWTGTPNTALSVGAPTVNTSITSVGAIPSNVNFVCFVCSGGSFNGDGTLAVTSTFSTNGVITHAFIIFNPSANTGGSTPQAICFTAGSTSCPVANSLQQDLQTVMTHEIGHFFGLDHSAIVRAMMFPAAPDLQRQLSYDDFAGISTLYPASSTTVATGSVSGMVTSSSGAAVFGAHVFADSTTGATNSLLAAAGIRKSPIGTLTRTDGSYSIGGLPADTYVVIAEPLDGPESNADVDWASTFGQSSVQTNFTSRWH